MKSSITSNAIYELESPFINLTTFKEKQHIKPSLESQIPIHRPFKSVYELEGTEHVYDDKKEHYVELMDELYDEEFDEFLSEIAHEARNIYDKQYHEGFQNNEVMAQQSVTEYFSPISNEIDRFMDYMIGIADEHDTENMSDEVWDNLVDQYVPEMETTPNFEDFGGWFKKKWKQAKKKLKKYSRVAKKWARKGLSYAKKRALSYALGKIKRYARTFINKAIKWGLKYIPKKYQPITKILGKRMGILREVSTYKNDEIDYYSQQELDGVIAQFILATDEVEENRIEQAFLSQEEGYIDNSLNMLDEAREEFVQSIGQLKEGESIEPAIENFAPAVMMAIKLGLKVYGRDKLISVIARPVSRLIGRYINQKNARILSRLLVDSGLKMFHLEVSPEQEIEQGNRAIAAVVEDTIREIAKFPEHFSQNEALLESYIVQAFETAAKTNFPDDILPEETYIKRPDLREASKHKVAWKMKKYGKGRIKKCRYKKLNKEIETELTPYLVDEIKTFGGVSLAKVLKDQMGVTVNKRIPVKIHLFQTLPGASRYHIGKNESILSKSSESESHVILKQIHPLTTVAAGLLIGEPALGCKSNGKCLINKNSSSEHRYYYIEIPNARPQMYQDKSGEQHLRKVTTLKIKLNFIKNKIKLFLFFSESDTQKIASQMRQHIENKAAQIGVKIIEYELKTIFSKHAKENIMVVHPNVMPGKKSSGVLDLIPTVIKNKLEKKIKEWILPKLSDFFMNKSSEFIQAANENADGLTVCITMEAPSDFNLLKQLINFKKVKMPEQVFEQKKLELTISVKSGYHYA